MKKVGCVLAFCNNYGTMLQSYATLKKIIDLGGECEIIRYNKHLSFTQKCILLFHFLRLRDFEGKVRRTKRKIASNGKNIFIYKRPV